MWKFQSETQTSSSTLEKQTNGRIDGCMHVWTDGATGGPKDQWTFEMNNYSITTWTSKLDRWIKESIVRRAESGKNTNDIYGQLY